MTLVRVNYIGKSKPANIPYRKWRITSNAKRLVENNLWSYKTGCSGGVLHLTVFLLMLRSHGQRDAVYCSASSFSFFVLFRDPASFSSKSLEVVRGLLELDPEKRLTCEQALTKLGAVSVPTELQVCVLCSRVFRIDTVIFLRSESIFSVNLSITKVFAEYCNYCIQSIVKYHLHVPLQCLSSTWSQCGIYLLELIGRISRMLRRVLVIFNVYCKHFMQRPTFINHLILLLFTLCTRCLDVP